MKSIEKNRNQKNFFHFIYLFFISILLISLLHTNDVKAYPNNSIQTIDLDISIDDIKRVEFGYHHSSFESTHIEYNLDVIEGRLTDGKVTARLSSLQPLLNNLKGMYPGTRPLYWDAWSDDYPHAWIYLHLNNGEIVAISSDSQFDGMFPWNVLIWESGQPENPKASYIQLNKNFLTSIEALWQGVGEDSFPRGYGDDSSFQFFYGDNMPETTRFYGEDDADTANIQGNTLDSLELFIPLLNRNADIKSLLDEGYLIYDAIFSLEVESKTLQPVFYNGTLALITPDKKDIVIALVKLPLNDEEKIITTFNAQEIKNLIKQRRDNNFLNQASELLGDLTFLIDTRNGVRLPEFECSKTRSVYLNGKVIQAIWNSVEPQRITFYPLAHNRWSIDFGMRRDSLNWNDDVAKKILTTWFPSYIEKIEIEDIDRIFTSWGIFFLPNVTLQKPELIESLKPNLPEQTKIHLQNPEKEGDFSFLSLYGQVILSENNEEPFVIYCGENFPDWYGEDYPIESVVTPDDNFFRQDMSILGKVGEWYSLEGSLPAEERHRTMWTSISFTKPGFLHVLWSNDRDGIYYADGWLDGTGWSKPQRLGEDSYWILNQAWPDGEIHLFWDAGLRTGGSIHVWKPAGGEWQKAEHWPIRFFSEILRDANGVLHIGTFESDGLDGEFMHRTWSAENGLSEPENISRRIGSTGNTTALLRLDSNGQLHAVWSHLLGQKYTPDPITGETPDVAGIFYAYRMSDGHWSKPEQVGVLAPYAHALSMEVDKNNNPLIIWQTETGLFSRIKENNQWQEPVELVKVLPPETPAEFGPERQVQPTAEISTGVNSKGEVIASWLLPYSGLTMVTWENNKWVNPFEIVTFESAQDAPLDPPKLEMKIDNQDQIHFVFFKNSNLYYSLFSNGTVETNPLGVSYSYYGLPEASLLIDSSGSIAVLGLPRSPRFLVKISDNGIPPTPIATITPVPLATPDIVITPIPSVDNTSTSNYMVITVLFILTIIFVLLFIKWRKKIKT